MPRFIFETRDLGEPEIDTALAFAASRFPEVRIEHRYTGRGPDNRETWVCSAPSRLHITRLHITRLHITRWTAAATIELDGLEQVDDKSNTPHAAWRAPNNKETTE